MMRGELAEAIRFTSLQGHRAVGNPDAFPIEIHLAGRGVAGGFLRASAGKKRPVEHGQFRMPGWIRNGDGEEAGIFVIHVDEFDAVIRAKGREPQTLPVEQILRHSQGDPWASGENAV